MICDELKKSLYLSCFQGKLSSRLSSDSDVSCLLDKIISTKKIDVKEIKKRKINDVYDIPYKIPDNWKWVKMGYLCDVIRGLTFSTSYKIKKDNTVLVLRGGNIDSKTEELIYDDNIYVDSFIPNDNQFLRDGDTLIVASSGTKTSVGKSAYVYNIKNNISFGGFMMVVRPYSEIVNPKYISYQIKMYRNKIINDTNGYISNITNEILNNLMIPLPPIEEQERIVDKIEQLFGKLDEIKTIENTLKRIKETFPGVMKKSVLSYGVTGKLTKQSLKEQKINILDVLNNDNLPDNWIRVKAKTILNITTGKKDANYGTDDGEYLFYTCANIPIKSPTYSFEGKNLILPGNGANVGLTIYSEEKFEAYQRTYVVNSKYDENQILLKYIYYYFNAYWNDYNKDKMFGSAIPYIKLGNLENFEINIPPIEEQQRIVEKLEKILPLLDDINDLVNE